MSHLVVRSLEFVSLNVDDVGTAAVHFRPYRRLSFWAGQHGLWQVPGGGVKPFTVASAPQEEFVTLGTSLSSASRFKQALARLAPGARARLIGPLGSFTADAAAGPVVMLAQGLGVTPFRAMLRQAALTGTGPRSTLVQVGGRHPFRADTEPIASHAYYPGSREAFHGFVRTITHDQHDATFMLSGSPAFVAATTTLLKSNGITAAQIRKDKFYGYAPSLAVHAATANGGTA